MDSVAQQIEIRANGLRFVAYAKGDGPLLLCLHGFPDHAPSFRHQFAALAAAGYRVVAPYMRGYAPSEAPADGVYQSAALARDALAIIEGLGEERATVFGHDWGAIAAYGAALKDPRRVERLITAAVPYGPAFIERFLGSYTQLKRSWYIYFFQTPMAEAAVAAEDFAFIRRLWADWSPGWRAPEAEMKALCRTFAQPGVLEAALGYYRCMIDPRLQVPELAGEQLAAGLTPIEVPALYLYGRTDGCLAAELAEGMEAMFPAGLRKVLVRGAGHFLHQEKPEEVNSAILEFLGKL